MMLRSPVYLATVCLERNRWGTRRPSFRVSDWLSRCVVDGFAGIELWENHYLAADADEQARLRDAGAFVAVFNTYAGFGDAGAEQRRRAAEAIEQLNAPAVKYNLGAEPARIAEYRRRLLAWADSLPPACRLLCECHPGTVLENPDAAAAFFADLAPERFGVIGHLSGDAAALERWVMTCGPRLRHLHVQLREPEQATPPGRARLGACADVLAKHGYAGSASIEFTRGIGRHEQIDAIYAQALADLHAYREAPRLP